jgi:hypothetical protein
MKAQLQKLEAKIPKHLPAEPSISQLIEIIRRQIQSEERRKELERQERARFYLD